MKSAPSSQPKAQQLFANQLLRAFTTALLVSGGSLGLVAPALADGTTAGTEIKNTAVGSFQNPNDTTAPPTIVTSNEVTVTVSEIAGIALTANGITEATATEAGADAGPTQDNGEINPEDVVYFTYTITNKGNDQTPFFIPGSPSNIQLNGTGTNNGGVLAPNGAIEIVSFSNDGGATQTPVGATVPSGGISTDDPAAIGAALGSIPVDGTVTIRVPVKLAAGLNTGDTVDVVLGDTPTVGDQNIATDGGANDVVTQDNTGTTNGDIDGDPTNGEREASATNQTVINEAPRDFGDLPAPYVSSDANGGPSHFIRQDGSGNNDLFLGSGVTAESDAVITSGNASDDGNDDGVTINSDTIATAVDLQGQSVLQGQQVTLEVTTVGDGNLQAWFDWNQDGVFDPGEQAITEVAANLTGGTTQFNVTVPFDATPGATYAMFRYSEDPNTNVGTTGVGGYGEVETFQVTVVGSAPELALVKRVTAIASPDGSGGFTDAPETGTVNDGVANSADDEANWPANYLQGTIDSSKAAPGEQIEYSLYFLSSGNDDITNLNLCDMIPANTTFVPGSISMEFNGTTTSPGSFFAGAPANPAICPADNGKGGILVNVVSATATAPAPSRVPNATGIGTPNDSFGTIKFRVTVD